MTSTRSGATRLGAVLAGLVLGALAASGCAKNVNAAEGTAEARARIAAGPVVADAVPVLAIAQPTTNLIEAGQAPLAVRAGLPAAGTTQTLTVLQSGSQSFTVDGEDIESVNLPDMAVDILLEVPAESNGDRSRISILGASASGGSDPGVAVYADSMLNGLGGAVEATVEPGGRLSGPQPVLADTESELLVLGYVEHNILSLVDPLPVEPIGVGAVWTTAYRQQIEGFPVTVFSRYTITSISGDEVAAELRRTVRFVAGEHPGAEILEDSTLAGVGVATWKAGSVVGSASYDLNGTIRYRLNRTMELSQQIRRTVKTTSELTVPVAPTTTTAPAEAENTAQSTTAVEPVGGENAGG